MQMEPGELAHERCEKHRAHGHNTRELLTEPSMYTWVRINVLIPKSFQSIYTLHVTA